MQTANELVCRAWRSEPVHEVVEATVRSLKTTLYLVGGAVRDVLLGRPVQDWDLLTADAPPLAAALAETLGMRAVLLHEEVPTYRLVLKGEPRRYLDLVSLRAPTLEQDLQARDFSLNAIAYDPLMDELHDPCGGLADVQQRLIRTLSRANLQSDPLRSLRAYRFHTELGFCLDEQTRQWLRETAGLIGNVAGERVGEELLKTLTPPRAAETLRLMDEDGLLRHLLPELEPMRGVQQGGFHHLDVWGHTLEVVANLEQIVLEPQHFFPTSIALVNEYLQHPRKPGVLLLTALLHDIGKPQCQVRDERGWWRFFHHDEAGAQMADQIARRLALRRADTDTLTRLIHNHLRPLQLANMRLPRDGRLPTEITLSALRRLFRETHREGIGLLLLGLADAQGCRGPATVPGYHEQLAMVLDEMLTRYAQWRAQKAERPLLTGQDLINAGFAPGPRFGEVLEAIEDAYADDLIQNREQALALAKTLFMSTDEGN